MTMPDGTTDQTSTTDPAPRNAWRKLPGIDAGTYGGDDGIDSWETTYAGPLESWEGEVTRQMLSVTHYTTAVQGDQTDTTDPDILAMPDGFGVNEVDYLYRVYVDPVTGDPDYGRDLADEGDYTYPDGPDVRVHDTYAAAYESMMHAAEMDEAWKLGPVQ